MNFIIKNYGCQMNLYDSMRISDALISAGYWVVKEGPENADILIFNTCSIREKADEKLFSDLGRAKSLKFAAADRGKEKLIIVCGCVAQASGVEIAKRAPYVDAIIGPQDIHKIVVIVEQALRRKKTENFLERQAENRLGNHGVDSFPLIQCSLDTSSKFADLRSFSPVARRSCSEFLTIQEGCNNFCTYCVVPFTRGREFSRSVSDIISEARQLVSLGVREITLLGQNVNSYHGEDHQGGTNFWSLARLLYAIASDVSGLVRLRYVTSNPKDVTEDMAKAHRDIPILMPFLHLPIQSGSDKILERMNRKYTVAQYVECVDMLREYRPDMAFSSDFIVGFPGENEKDFEETLKIAGKVRYAQAYSFKYSPREKTAAARMADQIPEVVKEERLKILQDMLNEHQNQFNENTLGGTVEVLFTKVGKFENQLVGRSEYNQAVSVSSNIVKVGDMAKVKVTGLKSHSLSGEIIERNKK